ncbi:TonB-dependent receptor [Sphingomonas sp. MG17]|uniref:TonB-dependent receptor n=1 Tax=Sphingomonas tagetis TaxID=2949092 RepID=A0A9X2KLY3_9SPHN|nr:TonB-dependent receptor [Sphingomonas tagetis]MCP3730886.1 TonB-dependent receptor [Sphingomonas tagetis]
MRVILRNRAARFLGAASLAVIATSWAATAQAQDAPAEAPAEEGEEIVVSGFRASLDAALSVKKQSVAAVDAIVAEDIAKFPDQNLAESLQRIPGIAIQRDGGEGRAITVRGLGAQFTRVRVNGLETIATTSDGASNNRERAFDFNVFASELFSSLVVHKTAEASLDEGSLGAVVDLNTGNPLSGKAGLTAVLSAQGSYNDLSQNVGPRVAGLIGWRNEAGTFGVAASAAYSKTDTLEVGNNTVRWAQAYFDSVDGNPCYYSVNAATGGTAVANSGGFYRPSTICDRAALAFHPRIPRYGIVRHDRERIGLTGSIQFAPTDSTKISIDGLYSRFRENREEKWLEVLLRTLERPIDVVGPVYDANGNMVSATLNDVYVRTEHYLRKSQTEFYQFGGTWDQEIGDTFRFTVLGGMSKSNADVPVETTLMYDDRDAQGYKYDYSDMDHPVLTYGTSVTDPTNFQLAELRDAPSNNTNRFKTAQLRTEWDVAEGFTLKAGAVWRRYNFDLTAASRNTTVCPAAGADVVLGTITCTASSVFGPTAVYGFRGTAALSELVTLPNAGQPAGTTTQWVIPAFPAALEFTRLYNRPLVADTGNMRGVQETTKGAYLQFDAKGSLLGLDYALNAGIRYVRTDQSSYGINNGQQITVERSYDDWLPAANLALYPSRDIIIRGAVAKVMTRPGLGQLTPGGSASGFAQTISFGNPQLNPTRATAYDVAVEWYFRPESVLSIALFKKDIESFAISATRTGTFLETGLPPSVLNPSDPASVNPALLGQPIWTITGFVNGAGANLKGAEISLQMPFSFLPGLLSNFGMQANATFVDSTATYRLTGPAVNACTRATPTSACSLVGVPANYTSTLLNLSKRAYNATIYYDDGKFSARASWAYRGPFNDNGSGNNNVFEGYQSYTNVDASVRYKLTDWIELSVEGSNLLDTYRTRYVDAAAQRAYENNHFGRTILFGARVKM